MLGCSDEYYKEIQARAWSLLEVVASQLTPRTVKTASELIDASDSNLAEPIDRNGYSLACELADLTGLNKINVVRLRRLVADGGGEQSGS
jgi:hypothetical protein